MTETNEMPGTEFKRHTEMDDELRKILESRKAEIKVCGIGGAGGNTISRLMFFSRATTSA